MLPGSVTYDGGMVSPIVHEAKSTIVLIFDEVVGGDISEKWCSTRPLSKIAQSVWYDADDEVFGAHKLCKLLPYLLL